MSGNKLKKTNNYILYKPCAVSSGFMNLSHFTIKCDPFLYLKKDIGC